MSGSDTSSVAFLLTAHPRPPGGDVTWQRVKIYKLVGAPTMSLGETIN